MIPPIKLPNDAPPLWLQRKLNPNGVASSASTSPAPMRAATAKSTVEPSGAGLSALSRAVKLSVNAPYLVKLSTVAPYIAILPVCLAINGKKTLTNYQEGHVYGIYSHKDEHR